MKTVIVDIACNILYSSFYAKGLEEMFGKRNVRYRNDKRFANLHYTSDTHTFCFIYNDKKYVIDFADSNQVFYTDFLQWADVYGKVNYNEEYLPVKYAGKIKPIGANFAINYRSWNKWQAALIGIGRYLRCASRVQMTWKNFISRYIILSKRNNEVVQTKRADKPYVFFVTRWWNGQDVVNEARATFIRACKKLQTEGALIFEGGMVSDVQSVPASFDDVILTQSIPYQEYLEKTVASWINFNTPAYFGCHGWKLPEYLSLGDCMLLSTPFVNELPVPLEHKKNIYFTLVDFDSIYVAIRELIEEEILYTLIKKGSCEYWKNYACPLSCVKLFLFE